MHGRYCRLLTCRIDHQKDDRHALGADVVRKDLHRVSDQETRPGGVVEHVVDVDHGNDGPGRSMVPGDRVPGGADGPDDEGPEHTTGGDEEELATTNLVDNEAHAQGDDEVADLEEAVDEVLRDGVGISDAVEDGMDIVGDEAVAGPLGEQAGANEDDQTMPISFGLDQFEPTVAFKLLLELDRLLNLEHLELNHLVLLVPVCMAVGEDFQRLLVLPLGDQESRRFRNEPDEEKLQS